MKKQYYLFFLLILAGQLLSAQIVNIPDTNFKDALIEQGVDTNGDGEIQESEAQSVQSLTFVHESIYSLVGIEAFTNLTSLNSRGNFFPTIDLSQNLALDSLTIRTASLTILDLEANVNLTYVNCQGSSLDELRVSTLTNLETLKVGAASVPPPHNLGTLDLTNCSSLKNLFAMDSGLETIIFPVSSSLEEVTCSNNPAMTSLDLSGNQYLKTLSCNNNNLSNLNLTGCINLETIFCGNNNLTTIDTSTLVDLELIGCNDNTITELNFSNNAKLYYLNCRNNELTTIDFSHNSNLEVLLCNNNTLTELDVSHNSLLRSLTLSNNLQLERIFLKNGTQEETDYWNFSLSNLPNLQYICADEADFNRINTKIEQAGLVGVVVNSYCSFTPGGTSYGVVGEVTLDMDTNGCDINDDIFPNLIFGISSESETTITIADTSGNYAIPLPEGMHTITPQLENPSYFTISPTSITVDFPTDVSPVNQNFCVTPNGVYNDLEITIFPLEAARPGFDTDYKIIYRNKGTTTLSGTVNLNFEDNFMNLVSANPMVDVENEGNVSWNYANLAPFESRSILYTMNLNTPTDENFPINSDDELDFTATITPSASDETPPDNTFTLTQIVVNSFDPNDKTCLEGNIITEDKVGAYVHYLIRFENTGTASAINVVVKDDIDAASYDISTLRVIEGSHNFITKIEEQKVEFIFENINLPFDDATNDGYVLFKIKTKATLVANDTFMNKAEIFFDFNAPIITNDEITSIAAPLSVQGANLDVTMEAFPKPSTELLYVQGENPIKTIDVYSLQGKLVYSKKFIGNQTSVNISVKNFSKGLYILKATSETGVFVDKIIKQ